MKSQRNHHHYHHHHHNASLQSLRRCCRISVPLVVTVVVVVMVLLSLTKEQQQQQQQRMMVGGVIVVVAVSESTNIIQQRQRRQHQRRQQSGMTSNKHQQQQIQKLSNPATNFFQYKCGSPNRTTTGTSTGSRTIWVYTGSLIDPYTGQHICNVEGIELIQPIGSYDSSRNSRSSRSSTASVATLSTTPPTTYQQVDQSFQRYKRQCRNLQIVPILEHQLQQQQQQHDTKNNNNNNDIITNQNQNDNNRNDIQQDTTSGLLVQPQPQLQSHTMLCRKLFCYTQPSTTTSSSSSSTTSPNPNNRIIPTNRHSQWKELLLTTFRKKSNSLGPITHIPLDQVITCYDSIVTSISVTSPSPSVLLPPSTDPSLSSSSSPSPSWWLHTEFPTKTNNKQSNSIWSAVVDHPSLSLSSFGTTNKHQQQQPIQSSNAIGTTNAVLDFSIFTRRRSIPLTLPSCMNIGPTTILNHNSSTTNNDTITAVTNTRFHRRQRRPWIQFGNSIDHGSRSSGSRMNELGVRETYQFYDTNIVDGEQDNNNIKVRYTRYGEAPVWYGPGRVCLLELTGTKLNSQQMSYDNHNDDGDINVALHTAESYVPVIQSIVTKYMPNIWNFCPDSKTTMMYKHHDATPPPKTSSATLPRKSRMDDDTTNFLYYAIALHPGLQMQQQQQQEEQEAVPSTVHEYHQYYNDLAVGRQLQHVLYPTTTGSITNVSPQEQLLSLIERDGGVGTATTTTTPPWLFHKHQKQIQTAICTTVVSTWDKLRSASTISIW